MRNVVLSPPKFGFIVATRAALAVGIGLLISERLEGRIAEALGNPEVDPHGDPIPSLGGLVSERRLVPLRAPRRCRSRSRRL